MKAGTEKQPNPDPVVVIGVKGSMITAKNSVRIRTRNYADWKLLKTVAGNHLRVMILTAMVHLNSTRLQLIGHVNPLKVQSNPEQAGDAVPADRSSESRQGCE